MLKGGIQEFTPHHVQDWAISEHRLSGAQEGQRVPFDGDLYRPRFKVRATQLPTPREPLNPETKVEHLEQGAPSS